MGKKGYSRQGFFGDIHHYDEHGGKTDTSRPGLFGGYANYDSHGKKIDNKLPLFLVDTYRDVRRFCEQKSGL